MSLNGYRRSCGKRSGGLRSIALTEASNVLGAIYDRKTGVCSQIVLKIGSGFVTYEFREGEASFSEEVATVDGAIRVRHEVAFSMERPDEVSVSAMREIIEASADGIIAVVRTVNGVSFLIGYSEKLGTEQPLRIKSSALESGQKFSDMTRETVNLASEDCEKAAVYEAGTI